MDSDPGGDARSAHTSRARRKLHAPRMALGIALALLTYALFPEAPATQIPIYEVGAVATDNVIAPFAFEVPKSDAELQREQNDVLRAAEPVFRFVPAALDSARAVIAGFSAALARIPEAPASAVEVQRVARSFGVALTPDEAAYLAAPARRDRQVAAVRRVFDRWVSGGVAASGAMDELRGDVLLRRGGVEQRLPTDSLISFNQLVSRARLISPDPQSDVGTSVYLKLITSFFRPTVARDVAATERRREDMRRSVPTSKYRVQAGEKIVGAHEVVARPEHEKLRALQHALAERRGAEPALRRAAGAIVFDLAIILMLGVSVAVFRPRLYGHWRSVVVVAAMAALVVSAAALVTRMEPIRPELVPVALAAVVLSALFDQRISMVVAMFLAILIGAQAPFRGTNALFINLIGGAVAALSVRAVARRHQAYLWLGATGAAYLVAAIAIGLMLDQPPRVIGLSAGFGALNAVGSIVLAFLLLPLAESFTGIETDLTLLEWSDLNRPLMQRLQLEAPGTFAHTMIIANLADAGARAIGANALLARVGAYYHDIGKLGRPQYFVENLTHDRNPHEALRPDASAVILRDHVAEGLRLAEQHRVPRVLRAFIPEHHGTAPMSYFLGKARDSGEHVNPDEYRYPGPVPQSAETAVVMLADSVEAATRVLNEPTPPRVREVIEHIVRQRLEQGQLRDAPLTLRQLEAVKDEFARVLAGMFHSRIEYPRSTGGVTAEFAKS